jgi:hypothetical protein
MDTDRSGRDAKNFLSPRGINGMTFLPDLLFNRYKCHHIYTGWWLPWYTSHLAVGATNRYKCEAFVPSGLDQASTRPCERAFVPIGASNWYKYSYLYRAKNTRYK